MQARKWTSGQLLRLRAFPYAGLLVANQGYDEGKAKGRQERKAVFNTVKNAAEKYKVIERECGNDEHQESRQQCSLKLKCRECLGMLISGRIMFWLHSRRIERRGQCVWWRRVEEMSKFRCNVVKQVCGEEPTYGYIL